MPDEVEPELDKYEDESHWHVARDPIHPYHCSECGFKSTTPYPVCPGCERLMSAECEDLK
jgi:lipopolysaccharide biosynthesis regulator YciM